MSPPLPKRLIIENLTCHMTSGMISTNVNIGQTKERLRPHMHPHGTSSRTSPCSSRDKWNDMSQLTQRWTGGTKAKAHIHPQAKHSATRPLKSPKIYQRLTHTVTKMVLTLAYTGGLQVIQVWAYKTCQQAWKQNEDGTQRTIHSHTAGEIAQLVGCQTRKPLRQVWFSLEQQGIFLPVNFQCRLSYSVHTPPMCNCMH